jgi:4-azaleucine resistance transporter AzlC
MRTIERTILRDALAISVAVGFIGVSFGVIATARGVSALQAQAMSLFVFAGASQFALIAGVGVGLPAAVAAGLLINARHIAFGVAVAPAIRGSWWRRALASQFIIDESTAYALAQRDPERSRQGFYAVGLLLFACWQIGTAVGALAGASIDYRAFGIDAAFPAGLLALLAPRLDGYRVRVAALCGAAIAVATTPFVTSGLPIALAAFGVVVAVVPRRRRA